MIKKMCLLILSFLILSACSVASPLTTTTSWLEAMKSRDYEKALSFVETEDKVNFWEKFAEENGKVKEYEVFNAIPLGSDELEKYQAEEGNSVYFKTVFENDVTINMRGILIKRKGEWKVAGWE